MRLIPVRNSVRQVTILSLLGVVAWFGVRGSLAKKPTVATQDPAQATDKVSAEAKKAPAKAKAGTKQAVEARLKAVEKPRAAVGRFMRWRRRCLLPASSSRR